MPSCSQSNGQINKLLGNTSTHSNPGRTGFPPELFAAVELLFFTLGRTRGVVGISAELFFAEAFAAMHRRDYAPSAHVQHFLQTLLSPGAYAGPKALSTYYGTVVGALVFARVVCGSGCGSSVATLCRWCLTHWGIPRDVRDALELPTRRFIRRLTDDKNGCLATEPNPSLAMCGKWIEHFQKRVKKIGQIVNNLDI